jgi:hypothetical protein
LRIAHLTTVLLLLSSMGAFAAPSITPTLLPDDHPILGVWSWTTPRTDCSEIYNFKANGQMLFSSGDEDGVSEVNVGTKPSLNGFYQFTNKVIADNGKKDCRGIAGEVGVNTVIYAHFLPTSNQMMMCYQENMSSCFGPLTRQ